MIFYVLKDTNNPSGKLQFFNRAIDILTGYLKTENLLSIYIFYSFHPEIILS